MLGGHDHGEMKVLKAKTEGEYKKSWRKHSAQARASEAIILHLNAIILHL